jgi:hypothetical protein
MTKSLSSRSLFPKEGMGRDSKEITRLEWYNTQEVYSTMSDLTPLSLLRDFCCAMILFHNIEMFRKFLYLWWVWIYNTRSLNIEWIYVNKPFTVCSPQEAVHLVNAPSAEAQMVLTILDWHQGSVEIVSS